MSEEDIIKSIEEYFNLDKVEEGEAFKRGYFSAMYRIKNIWKQLEDKNKKQKEILDKIKEYITTIDTDYEIGCWNKDDEFVDVKKDILELLEEIE